MITNPVCRPGWLLAGAALLLFAAAAAHGQVKRTGDDELTVSFRDASLEEVYEMLSLQGRVNILLGKGVTGNVSVNLYDVSLETAIRSIADSAGYVVERRKQAYIILDRAEAGKDAVSENTRIRTFKVQYTEPGVVAEVLEKYLSRFGKIMTIEARKLLVVEELPEFMDRLESLLAAIDVQPRQILIEARILEIALDGSQLFGIDWSKVVQTGGGALTFGTQGLAPRAISGLFLEHVTPRLEIFLNALNTKGRVRTLSTPKLLVLENQQAEVLIGDRLGFKVTTTINQVTTESIQFIKSGVILKVKAAIDRSGKIMLEIHPEVSTGTVTNGIPNVSTTEVTTRMLADDGQRIFIGGLIRARDTESRSGIPILGDVPLVGNIFSRTETSVLNTETVVMITPHIVKPDQRVVSVENAQQIGAVDREMQRKLERTSKNLPSNVDPLFYGFGDGAEEDGSL